MTPQNVKDELAKPDESINLSVISMWLRVAYPAGNSLIGDVAVRLYSLASHAGWYRTRYREFDKLARTLPEPYRTQAFDILANGKIAPWNETKEAQP